MSAIYRVPGKFKIRLTDLLIDGSSYAYSILTCEEKDPQIQSLVDVNEKIEQPVEEGNPIRVPNPNFNVCHLEKFEFVRTLKLNTNALTNIDKITSLPYLLEL